MIAGQLEVQMFMNMARLQNDMNEAKGMVGSAMGSIESVVGAAKTALGALGVGLSAGYFVNLIQGSIDAADHLNDLTKTTNLTVEEMSGLNLLANQSGTDLDSLAKAVAKMSVEMGNAPEKFRALGITATSNKEALMQFADVFAKLPDINQRNALSQAIFSKSWEQMAPVLAEGGRKIGETIDKGAQLSKQTREMAEQADKFNDSMAELKLSATSTGTVLANAMLPRLNEIVKAMADTARESGMAKAALVGFGALATGVFTDDMLTRPQKIAKELEFLRGRLDAETSSWAQFMNGLSDTSKERSQKEKNNINNRMIALNQELQAIQQAEEAEKKKTDSAVANQKREQEAAAAKAAAFLNVKVVDKEGDYLMQQYEKDLKARAEKKIKMNEAIDEAVYKSAVENAQRIADEQEKEAQRAQKSWERFAENVQRNLGDVLYNGLNGKFSGIGEMFKQMLLRMAADAAAAKLTQSMFGSSPGGGWAGSLMSMFGGPSTTGLAGMDQSMPIMASYAGGGYTGSGARSGGVDGMGGFPAIMHPNETVIDHSSGQSGGVVINDNTIINVDSRSDRAQVVSDVSKIIDQKQAQLVDRLSRQGVIA